MKRLRLLILASLTLGLMVGCSDDTPAASPRSLPSTSSSGEETEPTTEQTSVEVVAAWIKALRGHDCGEYLALSEPYGMSASEVRASCDDLDPSEISEFGVDSKLMEPVPALDWASKQKEFSQEDYDETSQIAAAYDEVVVVEAVKPAGSEASLLVGYPFYLVAHTSRGWRVLVTD